MNENSAVKFNHNIAIKEENTTHEDVNSGMDLENGTSSLAINHTNTLVMRDEENNHKKRRGTGNF